MHPEPTPEIERKYLLTQLPDLPPTATTLRLEQGYLDPPSTPDFPPPGQPVREGRLRRTVLADGTVICHHTIKSGQGLVRHERERVISNRMFEDDWPQSHGQRIAKLRHEVAVGDLVWQVDEILFPVQLYLAEVELPTADTPVELPGWLVDVLDKEVTDDPAFNNRAIARRGRA